MRPDLPSGTVTFLFTDIEGSTKLLHELGDAYAETLAEHRRVLREAFTAHGGVEVDTQGDAFFVAFARASDALATAEAAQRALADGPVRVRMGLHTGEPTVTDEGYVGADVHKGARIAAAGHGGQVLVSEATAQLVGAAALRNLGPHRLKDLAPPMRLYQLGGGEFPPLRTLHGTNLPVQPTALVGRERELAEAGALVREHRLVTLTGAGGSGKTRLALQIAADAVDDFPHGVFWVPLHAVDDAALVEPTIAAALGARSPLAEFLHDRRVLVLLDNLEHLLAFAPRLAELLAGTSEAKLLVTGREPLRIRGEQRYAVGPLPVEDAIALFAERARAIEPGFRATPAVAEVCRRVDCLPLAVELAAARVDVLDATALAARLERTLPMLTRGTRDLPARQRTLRATMQWSYALLDEHERRLFARLAVFPGGFDLEAAERVCGADVDGLQSLREKSLLQVRDPGRFTMLETIREYALERLERRRDREMTRERRRRHYLDLAWSVHEHLLAGDLPGDAALAVFERERDNLRASLREFWEREDYESAARLAGSLEVFWVLGHLAEGSAWLTRLRGQSRPVSDQARVRLASAAAGVAKREGDGVAVRELAREALAASRRLRDDRSVARCLTSLGEAAILEGRHDEAARLLTEAGALAASLGDRPREAGVIAAMGNLALYRRNYACARRRFEEALRLFRELDNPGGAGITLSNLGVVALVEDRSGDAEELFSQSLELRKRMELFSVGESLAGLGVAAARRGDDLRAVRLLAAAHAWRELAGQPADPLERELSGVAIAGLRHRLDSEFDRAWAQGVAMETDDAVEAALSLN